MMKIYFGTFVIALIAILLLSGCSVNTTGNIEDTSQPIDTSAKMDKQSDEQISGSYEIYAPEKLTDNTVLFFHASWCPSCRGLNSDIEKNQEAIPSDLTILKVDYDTQTALKQKYAVTTQHTLVQVDSQGNLIKKWSGGSTLEKLVLQVI